MAASLTCCLEGVETLRNLDGVRVGSDGVITVSAIHAVARVLLVGAEGLPAGGAELASSTGRVKPSHADTVADFAVSGIRTNLNNGSDSLVSGAKRSLGGNGPVSVDGVDIGVAATRSTHLNQDLRSSGMRSGQLSNGFKKVRESNHSIQLLQDFHSR